MSRGAQRQISKTKGMKRPNAYVEALLGEYSQWAFDEEKAPSYRGQWRSEVFQSPESKPLDLEIGTGNGFHFAEYAKQNPERNFVGIELKYKPLIQSIRRALNESCTNARMLRYNAVLLTELFAPEELNKVIIHFPDPWAKLRNHKHRLIQDEFLSQLFTLQRPGSLLEFKTDSRDYFDWAVERFQRSSYKMTRLSYDLHHSEWAAENFETHFERIFLRQNLPIHYCLLQR